MFLFFAIYPAWDFLFFIEQYARPPVAIVAALWLYFGGLVFNDTG